MITNLQKSIWKHPKSPSQNVEFSENRLLGKTVSSKVDLVWHLRPIRKVENARTLIFFLLYFLQQLDLYDKKLTFTRCVWSQPQFFMKRHFFIWSHLGFISWRIYSLLWRVRHYSKVSSKNRPSKSKMTQHVIFHEKWLKMTFFCWEFV